MQHVSSVLQPLLSLETRNTPSVINSPSEAVCFCITKNSGQWLKSYSPDLSSDSAVTPTSLATPTHTHCQGIQKRGTERAQGSVREGQIQRQNLTLGDYFQVHKDNAHSVQEQHGLRSLNFHHFISKTQTAEQNFIGWLFCSRHASCSFCESSHQLKRENDYIPGIRNARLHHQNGPC